MQSNWSTRRMRGWPGVIWLCLAILGGRGNAAPPPDPRHFELRVYEVTPGKMDAVQARFRDHIGRIRARHGIETLGYWTATNQAGRDQFIYLIAAPGEAGFRAAEKAFGADPEFQQAYAESTRLNGKTVEKIGSYPLAATEWSPVVSPLATSPNRAFELRIYEVLPGKMGAYLANYRAQRLRLFAKHGFTNLGYWTASGTNQPDRLVMLLAHENAALIASSKAAYHRDPEWQLGVDEWNKLTGPTTAGVVSLIMTPTPFSPWK